MTRFYDSLGYMHELREPLLKAHATFPPDPHQGAFRALVDDMIALRERRRRVTRKVKNTPVNTRDRPAEKEAERVSRADHIRPTPAPLKKSLSSLAAEAKRMTAESQRQTEEIQHRHAIALIADLSTAAKAGQLDAISAAKLDALQHRFARVLGLESTGVRS